jgi:hypothetical protein
MQAQLVMLFLREAYGVEQRHVVVEAVRKESTLREQAVAKLLRTSGWPHSYYAHMAAQSYSQMARDARRVGWAQALKEWERQLVGPRPEPIVRDAPMCEALGVSRHQRVMLVPLALFRERLDLHARAQPRWTRVGQEPLYVHASQKARIAATSFGLFLLTTDWKCQASSSQLEQLLVSACRDWRVGDKDVYLRTER